MTRFHLFEYTCDACSRVFLAPELVVGDYLTMRSEGAGSLVVMPTVNNSVGDEVTRLIRELPITRGLRESQIGEVGRHVLSEVYDRDEDGSRFVIGGLPRCSYCGCGEPVDWSSTEPPEFVDIDVPLAAHTYWDGLGADERRSMIADSVTRVLSS